MEKLRKKAGFTLVECVVAMAVLAVMTVALFMILSVTARQRIQSAQLEWDVDNQVEQIAQGNGTATEPFKNGEGNIAFENADEDVVFTINGAQKVYYEDEDYDLQIGAITIDAENVPPVTTENEGEVSSEAPTTKPPTFNIEDNRKVYSSIELTEDANGHKITISSSGSYPVTGPEDGYYTVTWEIKFRAASLEVYKDIQSVKVVMPPNVKVVKYWTTDTSWDSTTYIHLLSNNILRMEPSNTYSDLYVYVTFKVKDSEFAAYAGDPDGYITAYFGSKYPEPELRENTND